jgi:hypothetical protein
MRLVAAAGLVLIAATWPLWIPTHDFPRVPFVSALRRMPDSVEWTLFVAMLGSLFTLAARGGGSWPGKIAAFVFVIAAGLLVLADQHRLQPWLYEFLLLTVILAALPAREAVGWGRMLVVSIYVYSALSKLDWTFIQSGGGQVVAGLFTFLRVPDTAFSPTSRSLLAAALPGGELLVAMGLLGPRSRQIALWASIGMHGLLMAALGPWGAQQRAGVLLWNVYFALQNIVLFGRLRTRDVPHETSEFSSATLAWPVRFPRRIVRTLLLGVLVFPLTEPFGICDVWPAWAIYAAAPERLRVYVDEAQRNALQKALRTYVGTPRFQDGWCLVRIDRWSLDATGTPLYPQNRYRLGIAMAVAQAADLDESLHLEIDGPADRWTGRRTSRTLTGRAQLVPELRRFWLNGFPQVETQTGD